MTNLYADIGVEPTADAAAIKAAYRRRAKSAHPDAGGSQEQFERLNRAKLVLLDPRRRRQYDETGKVDESADDSIAKAMNVVVSAIDEVLGALERRGHDPLYVDIPQQARTKIIARLKQGEKHIGQSADVIRKLKAIIRRFSVKKGKVNRLGPLFAQRLRAAEDQLAHNKDAVMSMKLALEILDDHKFDFEKAAAPQSRTMRLEDLLFLKGQYR